MASAVIRRRNTQNVHAWYISTSGNSVNDAHDMISNVYDLDKA